MSTGTTTPADDDVFELRIYEAMPHRLDALHKRMGEDVLPVFARHGVPRPVANWECHVGPAAPLYVYMLRWPDMDERMAAFSRFYADPEWQAMYAQGPTITSMDVCFMRRAPAWPAASDAPPGGVHELRFHNFATVDSEHGLRLLRDVELPHMRSHGAVVLGAFSIVLGADTPRAATFVAWENHEQRQHALEDWERSEVLRESRARDYYRSGRPIVRNTTSYLMRPASYSTPTVGFGVGN